MTTAHKRDRHGFRGVPPPPVFDFDALPDGALLNEYETAAVGRWSTNTLGAWRLREGHGLRWVVIAGGFVRYRVGNIRAYLADGTPRKRKPKPAPPAAAPPRRRADLKPRSGGDALPAAQGTAQSRLGESTRSLSANGSGAPCCATPRAPTLLDATTAESEAMR